MKRSLHSVTSPRIATKCLFREEIVKNARWGCLLLVDLLRMTSGNEAVETTSCQIRVIRLLPRGVPPRQSSEEEKTPQPMRIFRPPRCFGEHLNCQAVFHPHQPRSSFRAYSTRGTPSPRLVPVVPHLDPICHTCFRFEFFPLPFHAKDVIAELSCCSPWWPKELPIDAPLPIYLAIS